MINLNRSFNQLRYAEVGETGVPLRMAATINNAIDVVLEIL